MTTKDADGYMTDERLEELQKLGAFWLACHESEPVSAPDAGAALKEAVDEIVELRHGLALANQYQGGGA